jgi:hypothetical protein
MLNSRFANRCKPKAGLHFISICFVLIGLAMNLQCWYAYLLQQDRKQLRVLAAFFYLAGIVSHSARIARIYEFFTI